MRRRLFAVASTISLLLCLGAAGLWVRGLLIDGAEILEWDRGVGGNTDRWEIAVWRGSGYLVHFSSTIPMPGLKLHPAGYVAEPRRRNTATFDLDSSFAGFAVANADFHVVRWSVVRLPLGAVVVTLLLLPSLNVVRRRVAFDGNACRTCGHSLRQHQQGLPRMRHAGREQVGGRGMTREEQKSQTERWDPLESTCRHASLSIL